MIYVLDTNVISDYIHQVQPVLQQFKQAVRDGHTIYLPWPIHYEVMRGLQKTNATRKQQVFQDKFLPQVDIINPMAEDWQTAAQLWAQMRRKGRQFSDVDLLLAAIATRLDATLISADDDFAVLSLSRLTWRIH